LFTTSTFIGFQEGIQQFITQVETNLKGEGLVVSLATIPNDNVQCSVKCKFDLMNQNQFLDKNPLRH
jgi:hypothetical protein